MTGPAEGYGVRASDDESFRAFVETRWAGLVRTAFLLVGDLGHAEDLVRDVFTRLWFVWPRLRDEAPDAYTRRALSNAATSWWRRRWRGERPAANLPDRSTAEDRGRDVVERDALQRALNSLPPRQRAAVILRVVEDLSESEVARALGCSVTQFAGTPMWVVAKGRLGGTGSPWVLLNYVRLGRSCTWLALVPTSPRATVTTPISGDCAPAPGSPVQSGVGVSGVHSPVGGFNRVLVDATVPAAVATVRAEESTGSRLTHSTRAGASPLDPTHRFYVFDAAAPGFIGTLTYYNAKGHRVGHTTLNAELPPPLTSAEEKAATACGSRGYISTTGHCALTASSWEESAAALAGFSAAGAAILAVPTVVLRRRRRRRASILERVT
jgi:RNA polymerase sigma-70 factor (sigma-E family)